MPSVTAREKARRTVSVQKKPRKSCAPMLGVERYANDYAVIWRAL
jgi:hypothetical protein